MKPFKMYKLNRYSDSRGHFQEVVRASEIGSNFKQMNMVYSSANVVRGLHYQINAPQGKFVGVIEGFIIDVAVSPSGEVHVFDLSPGEAVYIPPGYAHGYCTGPYCGASVFYLCTEEYVPEWDRGWNPMSSSLKDLPWLNRKDMLISEKDKNAPEFVPSTE